MKRNFKSKKLFYVLSLIILCFASSSAYAQCPFGEKVNCLGECGRFFDDNGDSYCDNGLVQLETTASTTETIAEIVKETKVVKDEKQIKKEEEVVKDETIVSETQTTETLTEETSTTEVKPVKTKTKKPYSIILISSIVLGIYLLTFLLVKFNKMKKLTHRKFWNVILLITCLVSCLLGFILALQINYGFCMEWYRDFLKLHVEFGIAMTIIAIIHIIWHYKYYTTMFSKKSK